MPNERDIKIHGISKQRYYELKAKTRQYAEWLAAVRSNASPAVKKTKCEKNIQAIQTAVDKATANTKAIKNNDKIKKHLLQIITGKESLVKIQCYYEIQLSKNTYYAWRRAFYFELDKIVD